MDSGDTPHMSKSEENTTNPQNVETQFTVGESVTLTGTKICLLIGP